LTDVQRLFYPELTAESSSLQYSVNALLYLPLACLAFFVGENTNKGESSDIHGRFYFYDHLNQRTFLLIKTSAFSQLPYIFRILHFVGKNTNKGENGEILSYRHPVSSSNIISA